MTESLRLRVHGDGARPTLIYLPGMHGDWTLLGAFRAALAGRARLVEVTYPRRAEWSFDDYAASIEQALSEEGVTSGWLLGESFSSQVAWALIKRFLDRAAPANRNLEPDTPATTASLDLHGLILVGGFIKHPWPWAVRLAHRASGAAPMWLLKRACALYGWLASRHHRDTAEICAELQDFVVRRTQESDRAAITSRYVLIAQSDFRPVAQRAAFPVFQLSGAIDPLVPWWQVRAWLRKNCPGYRESRIIRRAGHNVLLGAPSESAEHILRWIGDSRVEKGTTQSDPRILRR